MVKISIPDKTYKMYTEGRRTFIHVPQSDEILEVLVRLQFGNSVTLVNASTNEEFEQVYWGSFMWKENDRFCLIYFKHEVGDSLFWKRKEQLRTLSAIVSSGVQKKGLPDYQQRACHMLASLSALLFGDIGDTYTWIRGEHITFYRNEEKEHTFIVLDELELKTKNGEIFRVYSLFPRTFMHLKS